jgi:hypothetical protein
LDQNTAVVEELYRSDAVVAEFQNELEMELCNSGVAAVVFQD